MAAHHQLLYHIIFSVKGRRPLLRDDSFRADTWAYMAGVCNNLGGFAIEVGGYIDHVHLLVRIPAKVSVAEFVGKVKANTSKHINEERDRLLNFYWQEGYGAFTVSRSGLESVRKYIETQMQHHKTRTFQEEFLDFLERHEVQYDERYIWE